MFSSIFKTMKLSLYSQLKRQLKQALAYTAVRMGRAPCCDKANVKRGPWSSEEDTILKNYLQIHGTAGNWIALPRKAGLTRCGKSCRLRWLNYLRPDIKHGGFTEEEDNIICSLYNRIGSRWSVIASQLPGRTDNDVKNYWNTKLKKKLLAGKISLINSNSNDTIPTNSTAHLNSTQISPSIPEFGKSDCRISTNCFSANSGTNDIIYQQNYLGPQKGIIWDPNQATFSGPKGVSYYDRTSANNSYSTVSLSQEASSLSISSSLTMESNFVSWTANGDVEEQGSLLDFGFESPYELLQGFDFQKASSEIDSVCTLF